MAKPYRHRNFPDCWQLRLADQRNPMPIQDAPAMSSTTTTTTGSAAGSLPSLRSRLMSLVLACMIPTMFGLAVLLYSFYDWQSTQLQQENIITARALVRAVDTELSKGSVAAVALATSVNITEHELANFHAQATALLSDVLPSNFFTYSFVLSDRSGQQLVNTARPFGQPLPVTELPEQVQQVFATGKPVLSGIFTSSVLGHPAIAVLVPVQRGGKVLYTLEARLRPQHIGALLAAGPPPLGRFVSILDSKGVIVSQTNNHEPNKVVDLKAAAALRTRVQETQEGFVEMTTHEGIQVFTMFSRSPVSGWSATISIPKHAVLVHMLQSMAWLSLLVLALPCVGFAWA
jgi:hypothetical protein